MHIKDPYYYAYSASRAKSIGECFALNRTTGEYFPYTDCSPNIRDLIKPIDGWTIGPKIHDKNQVLIISLKDAIPEYPTGSVPFRRVRNVISYCQDAGIEPPVFENDCMVPPRPAVREKFVLMTGFVPVMSG